MGAGYTVMAIYITQENVIQLHSGFAVLVQAVAHLLLP